MAEEVAADSAASWGIVGYRYYTDREAFDRELERLVAEHGLPRSRMWSAVVRPGRTRWLASGRSSVRSPSSSTTRANRRRSSSKRATLSSYGTARSSSHSCRRRAGVPTTRSTRRSRWVESWCAYRSETSHLCIRLPKVLFCAHRGGWEFKT